MKDHEQIEEGIGGYDKLLVLLSDYSIQSEWVKTEIRRAKRRELKEDRKLLFPIRLTSLDSIREWSFFEGGIDLAAEIREFFLPDFSNWNDPVAFERNFNRLIKDLEAADPLSSASASDFTAVTGASASDFTAVTGVERAQPKKRRPPWHFFKGER
jgi:hypothetical protein